MSARIGLLLVSSMFLLCSVPVKAQRVTAPTKEVTCQFSDGDSQLLEKWARDYYSLRDEKDSAVLRKRIVVKLNSVKPCAHVFDFSTPHSIVFPVPDKPLDSRSVVRILLWGDDPLYATNLRGAPELFEVFITRHKTDLLTSLYTSTAVEDPRAAELAAALKQLGSALAVKLAADDYGTGVPVHEFQVRVGHVVLPYSRATISIKSQLTDTHDAKNGAKAEVSYNSATLNRIGFSLIGAGIIRVAGAHRVKIDGGKIVDSSFDGVASIFAVNFHPCPYDPTQLPVTRAERWRLFGGIVATPELGIAAGLSWAPFRSLSINAGYSWLRVKTTKPEESVGSPPLEGDTSPLRRSTARAFVLGAGYKFS